MFKLVITLFRESAGLSYLINFMGRAVDEYKTYFKHNFTDALNEHNNWLVFLLLTVVSQ